MLAVTIALAGGSAHGSSPDVFGMGSVASALAGAVTARAEDFSAVYYNPGALVLGGAERQVTLGLTGHASRLSIGGRNHGISDPVAMQLGLRAPIPLGGALADRFAVGFAAHILPDQILRVIAHTPSEPFFPYYDNRTQRLVVLPAIAGRIGHGLSIGLGANILAGLEGRARTSADATRALEPRIDERIVSRVRLHAGLLWTTTSMLTLGLSFRQGFAVPYATQTENTIAGESIDIRIDAEGLFTPDELWAGAALRPRPDLLLSLDVGYLRWSAWHGPYVTVTSALPIAGDIEVKPPALEYSDIVSVRAGAEWRALARQAWALALRAGAGFEPSPLPEQPGVTNLVDGNKVIAAVGAGILLPRLLAAPLRIDAHLHSHFVADRTLRKRVFPLTSAECPPANLVCGLHDEVRDDPSDPSTLGNQISNPGYPTITGGGWVVHAGLTVTFLL